MDDRFLVVLRYNLLVFLGYDTGTMMRSISGPQPDPVLDIMTKLLDLEDVKRINGPKRYIPLVKRNHDRAGCKGIPIL